MSSGSLVGAERSRGGATFAWPALRIGLPEILGIAAAVGLWYLAAATVAQVPTPHAVVDNALGNLFSSERLPGIGLPRGGYFPHLVQTAWTVMLGGGIGAAAGIATGLLAAESRLVSATLDPLVTLLGTIPIVIMAPFFLMWFGLSGVAQVALVAIYTATVLHLFTFRGARLLPPGYMDYAATLGASSRQRFLSVRLPGALPAIFGGLRIAFSAAWGLAAVTEMLGGQFGSGRVLVALRSVYDLTGIMAIVLLLSAFAILTDALIVAVRRHMLRWAAAPSLEARA